MKFLKPIESTVPTGAAPLSVASTTVVTNLNADLLDGNHSSAFATSGHVHAATAITNTPAGNIAATTVQAALNELDSEKLSISGTAEKSLRTSVVDRRSTVQTPSQFGLGVDWSFMINATDALRDGGSFHAVMHVQQWHDATGGGAYELGFTGNNNLWIRGSGTDLTSWGAWKKVIDDSAYTAADVLTKIKTVDGAASGLDADLLDGNHASAFAVSGHNHTGVYEPILGNPASNGLVLSSTAAGVRSWVAGGGSTTTPNLIATTYSVAADTSTMIVGTLEITATGALDNSGNVGVW